MNLVDSERMVFLAGNYEAQRLANYNRSEDYQKAIFLNVKNHFILSCIISDLVLQPVAHFHQSEITQWITEKYKIFFRPFKTYPPVAGYAVNFKKGTFEEDAKEKACTYTDNFFCYKDPFIRDRLTKNVNSIAEPFLRKGQLANSLSNIISENSEKGGKLFTFVLSLTGNELDTQKVLIPLREIAKEQKYALIPEYIQIKANTDLPNTIFRLMRLSLLESYTNAVETLYNAYPHNALYPFYWEVALPYKLNYLDTHLFQRFIRLVPNLESTIINGNPRQIMELKYSDGFQYFLGYYKQLVNSLKTSSMEEYQNLILDDYQKQKEIYQKKLGDLLQDPRLVLLLHDSLSETIDSRKFIRTKDILPYKDIPIFALVSEVMERFTGKYESILMTRLKKEEYEIKHKSNQSVFPINKLFITKELTMNIEKAKITDSQINIANRIISPTFVSDKSRKIEAEEIIHELIEKFCSTEEKAKLISALKVVKKPNMPQEKKKNALRKIYGFLNPLIEKGEDLISDTLSKVLIEWLRQKGCI